MTASLHQHSGDARKHRKGHATNRRQGQSIGTRVLHALRLASPGLVTDRWLIHQAGIPDAGLAAAVRVLRFCHGHRIERDGRGHGYRLLAQEKTPQDCNPRGLTNSAAATCELGHLRSSDATKHTEQTS